MNKQQKPDIEHLWHSLDNVQPIPAPDFFYAKLKAKLERDYNQPKSTFFLFKPAYLSGLLVAALVFNLLILKQFNSIQNDIMPKHSNQTIESVTQEYGLNNQYSVYE
ncbi:MAG: hypothetical protein ACOYKE_07480 [Ferruginibacter sp.]